MDTKILLENGTNELEILEFTVAGNTYGINVAKVTEIINYQPVTPIPNAHPSIEGIFMPRDKMITAIDLKNCLQMGVSEAGGLFIVTNFNKLDIAFHVDNVVGIHRLSWTEIIKPDATIASDSSALGVIKIKDKLIVDALHKAGYVHLIHTSNGQEAYDVITDALQKGKLKEEVQCLITDIEMPQMDGYHLTKLIKENDETKDIPVVIFSSIVNDEMRAKGEQLGVDAQLSKPEIAKLVEVLDGLLLKK